MIGWLGHVIIVLGFKWLGATAALFIAPMFGPPDLSADIVAQGDKPETHCKTHNH